MNKKEFSVYLHKPYLIDKHAEIALQEVVTDFPYFQAAHQLLLKAHQNNGSYHFEKQLPIASLLHGNRALLYAYLKDSLVREFRQVVSEDIAVTGEEFIQMIDSPFDINGEERKPPELKSDATTIEEEVMIRETQEKTFIPDFVVEESKGLVIDAPEEQEKENMNLDLPFQNFEEKYLNNRIGEDIIITDHHDVAKEFELSEVREEAPMTVEEEKVIAAIEPHDFLSWLQVKKGHITTPGKPVEKEEDPLLLKKETGNIPETNTEEKKIKKFNALIDRFIETSPSISKPQPTKFYNPAEKAKESVTENFDLVTETLAKIYIKQNNYRKAIMVYEKLSLLYPEKMSYFAARILELQTLLNK